MSHAPPERLLNFTDLHTPVSDKPGMPVACDLESWTPWEHEAFPWRDGSTLEQAGAHPLFAEKEPWHLTHESEKKVREFPFGLYEKERYVYG